MLPHWSIARREGPRKFETFTPDQVRVVLRGIANDRNRHV